MKEKWAQAQLNQHLREKPAYTVQVFECGTALSGHLHCRDLERASLNNLNPVGLTTWPARMAPVNVYRPLLRFSDSVINLHLCWDFWISAAS